MRNKLFYALALLVAALFSDITERGTWRKVRAAVTLWFKLIEDGKRVPASKLASRLAICARCPVFYKPLGTCGTPLIRELHDLGCWCRMAEKAKFERAQCWLDENGDGSILAWRANGV
jgi:hypothetical protein